MLSPCGRHLFMKLNNNTFMKEQNWKNRVIRGFFAPLNVVHSVTRGAFDCVRTQTCVNSCFLCSLQLYFVVFPTCLLKKIQETDRINDVIRCEFFFRDVWQTLFRRKRRSRVSILMSWICSDPHDGLVLRTLCVVHWMEAIDGEGKK